LIRAASASVADVCLFPVQDILVLGSDARMNTPSTPENNWTWRMAPDALTADQARGLAQLAELTDRDGWVEPPKP
jgi:4-alpha-glucanotransferase